MSVKELALANLEDVPEIDASELKALLSNRYDSPIILVDLRQEDELKDGVIRGSLRFPQGNLELNILDQISDFETPVVLVCSSGLRSRIGVRSLLGLGVKAAYSLRGGVREWVNSGGELENSHPLNKQEILRYSRHLRLPEFGVRGQERLKAASVLIVGLGGLGSPCSLYLAAAGIGKIGLVDSDSVDITNLQRQIIHSESDLGSKKVYSAKESLQKINSDIEVLAYTCSISEENYNDLIKPFDIVVDCTDNFSARYIINKAALESKIPLVHGAIHKFSGTVGVFNYKKGACYRCVYPEMPPIDLSPSCATVGVIGVLPGIIGTMQALEVIKIAADMEGVLRNKLLEYDALTNQFTHLNLTRVEGCICATY